MENIRAKSFLERKIFSHEILDSEELDKMVVEYQETRNMELREQIILHNQRLILDTAKRYATENSFFSVGDLSAYGNIGLMKAIEKFDKTKGTKFSSYARNWIKQAITRNIYDYARIIRIPSHNFPFFKRIAKSKRNLAQKLERPPTPEEIASDSYLSLDKVYDLEEISPNALSLESGSSSPQGNETFSLKDVLASENILSPDQKTSDSLLSSRVEEILEMLSPRERAIIKMRYGFNGYKSKTLQETGDEFSVTRERARQIEKTAIGKLKKYIRSTNNDLRRVDLLAQDKSIGMI